MSLTSSFAGVRAGLKSQVADPRQAPTADHSAQLLVVVETNFKIYAYTTSTLHVAMLSVFVDIVARLPNLAIGFITRESLRSALIHGISAQQIYDFLMKHAHPKMRRNSPVIPENIADQIYLWERERNRVQFMEESSSMGSTPRKITRACATTPRTLRCSRGRTPFTSDCRSQLLVSTMCATTFKASFRLERRR